MRSFPFRTALNASTLRPFSLDAPAQLRACAAAGFQGAELWLRDIRAYRDAGGSLAELGKLAGDLGIEVFDGIAFFEWEVADPAVRAAGIEKAKEEMGMLAAMGCRAVAAPPFGDTENVKVETAGERFARLWAVGREVGVEPYLEMWGHRGNIRTVGAAMAILKHSGVQGAKVLVDPIHIHKGGGSFADLAALPQGSIGVVHVNDFSLAIDRAKLTDKDRRFPGDGEADLALFRDMVLRTGYRGYLSLEVFIEDYGGKSVEEVARRGLESIRMVF
jgi:sugar phosphate isomerase/epimerase